MYKFTPVTFGYWVLHPDATLMAMWKDGPNHEFRTDIVKYVDGAIHFLLNDGDEEYREWFSSIEEYKRENVVLQLFLIEEGPE